MNLSLAQANSRLGAGLHRGSNLHHTFLLVSSISPPMINSSRIRYTCKDTVPLLKDVICKPLGLKPAALYPLFS